MSTQARPHRSRRNMLRRRKWCQHCPSSWGKKKVVEKLTNACLSFVLTSHNRKLSLTIYVSKFKTISSFRAVISGIHYYPMLSMISLLLRFPLSCCDFRFPALASLGWVEWTLTNPRYFENQDFFEYSKQSRGGDVSVSAKHKSLSV